MIMKMMLSEEWDLCKVIIDKKLRESEKKSEFENLKWRLLKFDVI